MKIKSLLNKIWCGWKRVAYAIGWFNSRLLLTIFYFSIIAFVALIKKIIKLFTSKSVDESFWIESKPKQEEVNFEQQF